MRPVRVFYTKKDTAKYISHLDINRCFQRAIRRAGVSIWYTEGFNPHAYITFALPLSLGYESECETMDMRLLDEMPLEEVKERLNRALPEGLRVYRVAEPVEKPDAILWADYRVVLAAKGAEPGQAAEKLREYLSRETLPVIKRTKRGEKEIDLRPYLQLLEFSAGEEETELLLRLAAGGEMNVNPTLVLDSFCGACGMELEYVKVARTAVWDKKGEKFA
ncbi:MAG: TIGR03936 family radical SAM-associated protein [Oscillospiraceae bacterium]|nr:TIGR03936 family radical SAM-associated protein [Oscillospiraceae bacterium]